MCYCALHVALVQVEARRVVRSPEGGVLDNNELLCLYWELNPGPLKEQLSLKHIQLDRFFI